MLRQTFQVLLVVLASAAALGAQTIAIRSGNGSVGGADSRITLIHGASSAQPLRQQAFTAQDFQDARDGSAAQIVTPHSGWLSGLSDPQARWVAIDSSRTPRSALLAISFVVENTCWQSANLDFSFATDDQLGDNPGGPNDLGLFLNGKPLAGTQGGGRNFETNFNVDLTTVLQPGENTLYVYGRDVASIVSGVIFSGRVQITPLPAPVFIQTHLTSNRFNATPNNTFQLTAVYDGDEGSQQLEIQFRHPLSGQTVWLAMPVIVSRSTQISTFEYDLCDWVPTCRCRVSGAVPNGSVDGIAFGFVWKDKDGFCDHIQSRDSERKSFMAYEGAWPVGYTDASWDALTPQLANCPDGQVCRRLARMMLYGSELLGNGTYELCCQSRGILLKK